MSIGRNTSGFIFPLMQLDEMFVFVQYDQRFQESDPRRFAKHTFHTAFFDDSAKKDFRRRASIEVRLLCAFEDDGDEQITAKL